MKRTTRPIEGLTLVFVALQLACGAAFEDSSSVGDFDPPPPSDPGGPTSPGCATDADCVGGLVCLEAVCVSPEDDLPPEEEVDEETFLRPKASQSFVYALSPSASVVAVIDAVSLSIEAVPVPPDPVSVEIIPGLDSALVLSKRGRALTLLSTDASGTTARSIDTRREFGAVSVSPDGQYAILWTPDGLQPPDGAEGLVAVVDLGALLAGETPELLERAAGRRHTDVIFLERDPLPPKVAIIGKSEVAFIDLQSADDPLPERRSLPEGFDEILTREVVSSELGEHVLIRSLDTRQLAIISVATSSISTLTLPGVASDIDLSADGRRAVIALRSLGEIAWFGLGVQPGPLETISVDDVRAGQIVVSPEGDSVLVFTNSEPSEEFARVNLNSGVIEHFSGIEKWIRTVGVSPDSRRAIVLHRANETSSVADSYEAMVDRSEGYSVVDLDAGYAQLKLTGAVRPLEFVYSSDSLHAAVTLRDDRDRIFSVDAIDLETMVTDTLELASAPEAAGALLAQGNDLADRIWVTQAHAAGRISFVDLGERQVRTVTGYTLNSEIE